MGAVNGWWELLHIPAGVIPSGSTSLVNSGNSVTQRKLGVKGSTSPSGQPLVSSCAFDTNKDRLAHDFVERAQIDEVSNDRVESNRPKNILSVVDFTNFRRHSTNICLI